MAMGERLSTCFGGPNSTGREALQLIVSNLRVPEVARFLGSSFKAAEARVRWLLAWSAGAGAPKGLAIGRPLNLLKGPSAMVADSIGARRGMNL